MIFDGPWCTWMTTKDTVLLARVIMKHFDGMIAVTGSNGFTIRRDGNSNRR